MKKLILIVILIFVGYGLKAQNQSSYFTSTVDKLSVFNGGIEPVNLVHTLDVDLNLIYTNRVIDVFNVSQETYIDSYSILSSSTIQLETFTFTNLNYFNSIENETGSLIIVDQPIFNNTCINFLIFTHGSEDIKLMNTNILIIN